MTDMDIIQLNMFLCIALHLLNNTFLLVLGRVAAGVRVDKAL